MISCGSGPKTELRIALAGNLAPLKDSLALAFEKETGLKCAFVVGSSGGLSAQIQQGAEYDGFLSADFNHPQLLFENGFSSSPPEVYGHGMLVMCTRSNARASVPKYAIPNPDLAPFGLSAMKYLDNIDLVVGRDIELVYVENVAQVNAVLTSGAVDGGFSSMTFAIHKSDSTLQCIDVSEEIMEPIEMAMVSLNTTEAFKSFKTFMLTPAAQAILKRNGIIPVSGS